jgi:hypothetical protein
VLPKKITDASIDAGIFTVTIFDITKKLPL